ncbi:MAG: asparaginase [Burkholderiaceae bacterium]|nr:asparaginase [Burkholderiaceae bacterium]
MSAKKIVVLGTGGTIAGVAALETDNLGYQAGQLGVAQLLAAVPGLCDANAVSWVTEQVAQRDSKDMDFSVWRTLALRCAAWLADPSVHALVITHGTDTLEETAWWLDRVLGARKPVVLTCAMRPATALAPDGPQNLRDALAVALAPGVCGVLVVAAGVVHGARRVQKVHPYRLDAFGSGDAGPLGWVEEGRVRWASDRPPEQDRSAGDALEKIANATEEPWVEIVMSHAGARGALVDALVREGVQGLVVAATGNGSVHQALEAALVRAQAAGVRVLCATRCPEGAIVSGGAALFADAQGLSPVKARIALVLELVSSQGTRGPDGAA